MTIKLMIQFLVMSLILFSSLLFWGMVSLLKHNMCKLVLEKMEPLLGFEPKPLSSIEGFLSLDSSGFKLALANFPLLKICQSPSNRKLHMQGN